MNITIIEKEVNDFCTDFFRDVATEAKRCLDFREKNGLYTPKENYTVLPEFLDSVRKKFKVLDSHFESATLEKLAKDVRALEDMLSTLKSESGNIIELFKTRVVQSSKLLNYLLQEIASHKLLAKNDAEDKAHLASLESNFKEIKKIYYDLFSHMFYADREYYIGVLAESLNFKAYYYDKLLWSEASSSNFIIKHFQVKQISDKIDSKHYLQHLLSLMRPYTQKYEYYQSCIRIYK